ncbi:MAG: hypothetical protein MUC91_11230 [Verrucomicrobia bacterium]|nr:hypothetical protein [Verrucomicrobiota bacterium]
MKQRCCASWQTRKLPQVLQSDGEILGRRRDDFQVRTGDRVDQMERFQVERRSTKERTFRLAFLGHIVALQLGKKDARAPTIRIGHQGPPGMAQVRRDLSGMPRKRQAPQEGVVSKALQYLAAGAVAGVRAVPNAGPVWR